MVANIRSGSSPGGALYYNKEKADKGEAKVLFKYFDSYSAGTWLIPEAERDGDDWRLFGYCHIFEWEWGYLMLSKLESLRLPFGMTVERDLYTSGKIVRDFLTDYE